MKDKIICVDDDENGDGDVCSVKEVADSNPSHVDVLGMVQELKKFAISKESQYLNFAQGLESLTDNKCGLRQSKLDSFVLK